MITNSRKGKQYKIVVAGHFNSGKTTFIKTVSKGNFLSSERKTS
jgi:signal recognition particle receptor subunit beta